MSERFGPLATVEDDQPTNIAESFERIDLADWRYIVHEFCTIRNRDARVVEVIKMGAAKFYETTAK